MPAPSVCLTYKKKPPTPAAKIDTPKLIEMRMLAESGSFLHVGTTKKGPVASRGRDATANRGHRRDQVGR